MAMEYLYLEQETEKPIKLKNFRGLQYSFGYDDTYGNYILDITDNQGERQAFFQVEREVCYVLQRRNQSALQLHEVTPPRLCMDKLVWLFGFGRKQHCENYESFIQAWKDYQNAHPDQLVIRESVSFGGSCLCYAFVFESGSVKPIAYYYELAGGTAWAFLGKETEYRFIYELHNVLHGFKYPLQYVIRVFRNLTMSYPVETKNFFQNKLRYWDKDVYYADCPESGF